ncbi:MAG: dihydropteroate synthase [Haloarculaceae archaeon]
MEFHEAANFLFDLRRFPLRPGTDATRDLLAHLGDPHADLRCVQVAGSNGKGSTARMLERTLREAGLDVGLYTSPHLEDVHERVRVNGRYIREAALVEFVETVEPYVTDRGAAGTSPTFFETLTALALWEFDRQDVDVAVLEVGIGGQYDATSVIDPAAAAVTSVTLEHTGILGDTVAEIARDMAHVAPADAPLVTAAEGEALAAAREVAGDVVTVGDDADVSVTYRGREGLEGAITAAGPDWSIEARLPLLGAHQARNAGVAATLARQVADVDADTLARGLRNAHWPGRFEVLGSDPLAVLDGAHNPAAVDRLVETLSSFDYDDLHVVAGAMVDKDLAGIARSLRGADHVIACQPSVDRAQTASVVATAFERETDAAVETHREVTEALATALAAAGPDDCVLVTGSLYAVAEARTRWTRSIVPAAVEATDDAATTLSAANVPGAGDREVRERAVHRVLRTRVKLPQARRLREELLALGGECAISGVEAQDRENRAVVLMATLDQYRRLADRLAADHGLATLAEDLRGALGIDGDGASRGYPWEDGTAVMGILNVTPDSFHDGGEYDALADAVERAEEMAAAGVDVIDVGGESTRPGADVVPVEAEIDRVVPVIERLADLDALVSIDTRKAPVARAALEAGADILNDVSGLADPEMRLVAADHDVPVVVMHSIETPVDPDTEVDYDDVVADVIAELEERVLLAEKAGLDREQIIVDPGLGFGKDAAESFELLGRLGEFEALGCPILVGHSHKSMFGLVGERPGDCLEATIAGTAIAADRGADIVRVHDAHANVAAVRVVAAARDPRRFE